MNEIFEDNILTLRNYSFISVSADGLIFEMHRLVQLSMQERLKAHGQVEVWKRRFIKNLCRDFPAGKYENWEKCQSLFPHIQLAMVQRPEKLPDAEDSLEEWALLLYNTAWFASSRLRRWL
jgi:hypothetical protein